MWADVHHIPPICVWSMPGLPGRGGARADRRRYKPRKESKVKTVLVRDTDCHPARCQHHAECRANVMDLTFDLPCAIEGRKRMAELENGESK